MTTFVRQPDGNAIVYCEGAFLTPNGKTAHGLVRFTKRYRVTALVDSTCAGADAAELIGLPRKGIPVVSSLEDAFAASRREGLVPSHFVVGLAPDGGRLSRTARADVKRALGSGLDVDCGLHDYLGDDPELAALAESNGALIRDIRRTPPTHALHFFSGKIEEVDSLRIAVLGTDSAIGKRTTALVLANYLSRRGSKAEMIGTGQTAWMQGLRYGVILDSLVNDFVAGEIEHAVWTAWKEECPDSMFIEGQGSLLNPAYPGGFEILAAARPHGIVLQHAPARKEYDGFPGYPLHDLETQIEAIKLVSSRPVVAIAINHENVPASRVERLCREIERAVGLPAADVVLQGPERIADAVMTIHAGHHVC